MQQAMFSLNPRESGLSSARTVVLNLLMLRPFSTVPRVVVTPNHKIILLLLHNYNFATVINHNVNI